MTRSRKVHYDGNGYIECKQKGEQLEVTTVFDKITCATCKGMVIHEAVERSLKLNLEGTRTGRIVNYGLSVLPQREVPWDKPRVFTVEEWAAAHREMKEVMDSYHPSQERQTILADCIKDGYLLDFEADFHVDGDKFELMSMSVVEHGGEPVGISAEYQKSLAEQPVRPICYAEEDARLVSEQYIAPVCKTKSSRKQKRELWPAGSKGMTFLELRKKHKLARC